MSNLVEHAKHELDLIGMVDTPDGDDTNYSMRRHILHMVSEFSKEGHSGFSANYAINLLIQLLKWMPLTPLTGEDDEWEDRTDVNGGKTLFQNKRYSKVFKDETGAYDIEGLIFWEWATDSEGNQVKNHFTTADSRVLVDFPYAPKIQYVQAITPTAPSTDVVQ